MSCRTTRSIALLLVLVTLIACTSAHPSDGTDSFENMDWSFLASMGEQFSGIMAHDQFAQMTTSPMPGSSRTAIPTRSPPRSHPRPELSARPIDDHFGNLSPWGMELPDNLGLGIQNSHGVVGLGRSFGNAGQPVPFGQTSYAQQGQIPDNLHYGQPRQMGPSQRAVSLPSTTVPPSMSVPMQQNNFGPIGVPINPGYAEQPYVATPQMHQEWTMGNVPMQSGIPDQLSMHSYPPPSLPVHLQGSNMAPFSGQPAQLPTSVPDILSPDVTDNYNYQHSMVPNNVGMLGWIGRAPTTGDRAVPRLNTNHLMDNSRLLPPEPSSANRSPTSASTTGSSGGRPASRRRHWHVPSGNLQCHWCSLSFTTQGDLTHHLRSHAPYMSRQHVCHHCEKRFQYRKDLARHLPKHDPHRQRYYCPISNCKYHAKGFGRQDHLDRHMGSQHRLEPQRADTPQRARTPSQ